MKKNVKVELGIAAAVAAAAAGAYFLYGKMSVKDKKKVKSWMLHAKADVLDEIEKIEHVTERGYHEVVKTVLAKYGELSHVDKKDVAKFLKEMKGEWQHIERSAKSMLKKKPKGKK